MAALLGHIRGAGRRVAVLAVDPSSPISGGAVLGDRIRMMDRHADNGVFVRSMASRGRQGGLAWATAGLVHLLDAVGYPLILIETVGTGQDGLDIASLADTVVVVEAPGLGDGVQAIKSGLLEVGDIIVVNKADQPGAEDAQRLLRAIVRSRASESRSFVASSANGWHTGESVLRSCSPRLTTTMPGSHESGQERAAGTRALAQRYWLGCERRSTVAWSRVLVDPRAGGAHRPRRAPRYESPPRRGRAGC